jgi:muconolactone D-isomerase
MEFLVNITINLPPDLPEPRRSELLEGERLRGLELIGEGKLVRIWRLPGRFANISLYRVADATELHAAVTSLPLWPWMEVHVEPLAAHPLESAP